MKRVLSVLLGLLVLFGGLVNALVQDDVNKFTLVYETDSDNDASGSVTWDSVKSAVAFSWSDSGGNYVSYAIYMYNETFSSTKLRFNVFASGGNGTYTGVSVGVIVTTTSGIKYGLQYKSSNKYGGIPTSLADQSYDIITLDNAYNGWVELIIDVVQELQNQGVSITESDILSVQAFVSLSAYSSSVNLYVQDISPAYYSVTFNLKDALTGQSLTGVTVKEGNTTLGTIDDGGSLELTKDTHTLTFEKTGYWSVQKTIDVQSDMSVTVEMYPDTAAFKFFNFPSNIQIYENSIYELTFTLSPIDTSATYNTYLSLSGLSDVLEVRKDGQLISPEGGKYYLGDIGGDTQVSIKFKATTVGTKAFSITLTSNDAIMSKTYTTSKQVPYEVVPLPFSIQLPDWTVGENSLRIAENSGQNMVLTLSLKDSEGNEVWSDSYSFGPYESHEFTVNIPKEGVYTLEIQFSGTTAVFDINVNPPIQLLTESITVGKGDVGAIQLLVKNPSSLTKYYEVVLTGGFIEGNITKAIAIAPASEKTVEIAFQVPKDVQFDAYDLQIEILEGNEVLFKGLVHVMIDNSGFSLPIGSGGSTLPLALGALILIGGAIYVLRRR